MKKIIRQLRQRFIIASVGFAMVGGVCSVRAEVFQEAGGLVVMDIESTPAAAGWVKETTVSGYLGSGYYTATIDSFNTPGNGVMEYAFTVENAGEYQLQWRSRIVEGTSNTDSNDTFGRIVDENGIAVAPIANNLTPHGTEHWYKIYMNTLGAWTWKASNHDNLPRAIAWNLQAGQTYRMQVSYRSKGHAVDRLLLWNRGGGFNHNFGDIKGDPLNEVLADGLPLSSPVGAAGYTYYALTDFPVTDANAVPYYNDADRSALAIDATEVTYRDQFAKAETTFAEEAGTYDITITALRELDGECTYRLYVNDTLIGSNQNATTAVDYAPQNHSFADVLVPAGATLAVESDCVSNGKIPEGGGFAYARGRWTKLHLAPAGNNQATVGGELKQWHKVMLSWVGPDVSESESTFMNYRLDVTFTHSASGKQYIVPGFYAADGDAGESSASAGNIWRANFMPDEVGDWIYQVSFRVGDAVAVSSDLLAGVSAGNMDGDFGVLTILSSDKAGADFRSATKGKLIYTGASYPEWMGGEGAFLKAGCNSPEVFLEYAGFDGTSSARTYPDHIADWNSGDPTWKGTLGKGMIGVVNYLSGLGINSHYFLTMNVKGDGKQAFPWINDTSHTTYDVSKLAQWAVVFEYMMSKGIQVQFVLSEQENQSFFEYLDGGTFADSRKLYYREMVARFGYLNAITWNVGEENGWQKTDITHGLANSTAQRLAFANHLSGLLPYADNIAIHNGPSDDDGIYDALLGSSAYRGISYQGNYENDLYGHDRVLHWNTSAATAGQPWIINYDEPYVINDPPNTTSWRENSLWAAFSAGAAGVGYYVGSGKDLNIENYRNHETFWQTMVLAKEFLMANAGALTALSPDDSLVSIGWCLADPGSTYVIYLKDGGTTTLDLSGETGSFDVKWFDPRNGGVLQDGSVTSVNGGGSQGLGTPPSSTTLDWVVLVQGAPIDTTPVITTAALSEGVFSASYSKTIAVSDGDAPFNWSITSGSLPVGLGLSANGTVSGTPSVEGSYDFTVRVEDVDGDSDEQSLSITIVGSSLPDGPVVFRNTSNTETTDKTWTITDLNTVNPTVSSGNGTVIGAFSAAGSFEDGESLSIKADGYLGWNTTNAQDAVTGGTFTNYLYGLTNVGVGAYADGGLGVDSRSATTDNESNRIGGTGVPNEVLVLEVDLSTLTSISEILLSKITLGVNNNADFIDFLVYDLSEDAVVAQVWDTCFDANGDAISGDWALENGDLILFGTGAMSGAERGFRILELTFDIDTPFVEGSSFVAHYDASRSDTVTTSGLGVVTQWADLSGSGNDAQSDTGSVYYPGESLSASGLVGLDFGTNINRLLILDDITQDALFDFAGDAINNSGFCVLIAFKCDQLINNWNDVIGNSTSIGSGFFMRHSSSGTFQAGLDGAINKSGEVVAPGDTIIMAFNYDASTGAYEFWDSKNNSSMTGTKAAADFSDGSIGKFLIGGTGTRFLNGGIFEVKIYSKVLDSVTFEAEKSAMVEKWTGFEGWADSYGLVDGRLGDDDDDGQSNLKEFYFGGNPTNAFMQAQFPQAAVVFQDGTNTFRVVYYKRAQVAAGTVYHLEQTETLIDPVWVTVVPDVIVQAPVLGDITYLSVTNDVEILSNTGFIRLVVQE